LEEINFGNSRLSTLLTQQRKSKSY